jgi:flagellar biosynthetic protein FliP
MRRFFCFLSLTVATLALYLLVSDSVFAQDASNALPNLSIAIGNTQLGADGSVSSTIKIMILLTLLSFAPAMIMTMTSFTRISVVLGMVRTTIGTQSMPPNMVITGLSLFLTFAIMQPVMLDMYKGGIGPFMDGSMSQEEALPKTFAPLKKFLVQHARDKDLALFLEISKSPVPEKPEDVPIYVAAPAFVLSELNLAFQISFMIALPFLILDMVVSSVLTSMSMITLPPVVISLPLKLMLFVIVDGWHLIITSLVQTYRV